MFECLAAFSVLALVGHYLGDKLLVLTSSTVCVLILALGAIVGV